MTMTNDHDPAASTTGPDPVVPELDPRRSVRELALQVGTYGAAAMLALVAHDLAHEVTRDEALALLAAGLHADLALRSGDGYRGTAPADLARLVPDLTVTHAHYLLGRLTHVGMVDPVPGTEPGPGQRYRLAAELTDPFDTAPPAGA